MLRNLSLACVDEIIMFLSAGELSMTADHCTRVFNGFPLSSIPLLNCTACVSSFICSLDQMTRHADVLQGISLDERKLSRFDKALTGIS